VSTRYFCNFASVFRSESTPCICHETFDRVKTLCGRNVADAAAFDEDNNDLEADCIVCKKKARKLRAAANTLLSGETKTFAGVVRRTRPEVVLPDEE
jgi:hypothetical protein